MNTVIRYCGMLLWAITSAYSQVVDSTLIQTPYTASFFEKRLPDFNPLKNPKYKNVHTAFINAGKGSKSLELFWANDSIGSNVFWLIIRLPDSSITLQKLDFGNLTEAKSIVKTNVRLSEVGFNNSPLELCLLPQSNVLLFRWLGTNTLTQNESINPVIIQAPIYKGGKLPEIKVKSLDGRYVKLNDLKDKMLVLNWWSTGCKPCIEEMPGLNKLVEKYKSSKIEFIAIAWNTNEEIWKFIHSNKFNYQQYIYSEKVDSLFGNSFPRNIIVNSDGIVIYDSIGGSIDSYLELQKELDNIIKLKNR